MTGPGAVIAGRYVLGDLLGRGGMGAVFRAEDGQLRREVAVKVLRGAALCDDASLERFRREAVTVARLRSPHLVTIYDTGVDEEHGAFIVMELLVGRSLREELRARGPLAAGAAVRIARDVLVGVQAAHDAGVVHRDLKPENIFIEHPPAGAGVVKVLDFGIAKLVGGAGGTVPTLTLEGQLLGTPPYMSPEQCAGSEVGPRSDVYSVGCVLYEMTTGRPPFLAGTAVALVNKHLSEVPTPPSALARVPPALEAAILRALAKAPERRFASAEEFRAALGAAADTAETLAEATTARQAFVPTVVAEGLRSDTAALATPPTNLPRPLSSFLGRARDVGELEDLIASHRLVTLAGPGGIGKTRLAIEASSRAAARFPDGVWWVDLSPLTDGRHVPGAVAAAVGVRERQGEPLSATLCRSLSALRALIVLDNCEHVVEDAAAIANALVRSGGGLHLLATTRELLGVPGERVVRVAPLEMPRAGEEDVAAVESCDAVRLFVERVRLARPEFGLAAGGAAQVAELVRRLDGLPLAIELAASRARTLPVAQILERLDDRFRLLTGGGRVAQARQQSLRAAVDWSFGLLPEPERAMLRRTSVFAGGWTLAAAEAVCAGGPVAPADAVELLSQLADKSFVIVEHSDCDARFRALETIREYAAERLDEAGEAEGTRAAHAEFFAGLAERAQDGFYGPGGARWVAAADAEHDNLRASLRWSLAPGADPTAGLRICGAMGWYWIAGGHWAEGRSWVELALARSGGASAPRRAAVLVAAATLAHLRGDYDSARSLGEEALALQPEDVDPGGRVRSLRVVGVANEWTGNYETARGLFEESLALARRLGDRRGAALALCELGMNAMDQGRFAEAVGLYEEALGCFRETGNESGALVAIHNLGDIALREGDLDRAATLLAESRAMSERLGNKRMYATSSLSLGGVANENGRVGEGAALLADAIRTYAELGSKTMIVYGMLGVARAAAAVGRHRDAVVLEGAAGALCDATGTRLSPGEESMFRDLLGPAHEALGPGEAPEAIAAGSAMPFADAVAHALAVASAIVATAPSASEGRRIGDGKLL